MKKSKKNLSKLVLAVVLLYTIGLPIQNIVLANTNAPTTNEAVVTEEATINEDEMTASEEAEQPTEEGVQEEKEISEESISVEAENVSSGQQLEEITGSKEEEKEFNQPDETEKTIKKDVKAISPDKISSIFPDANLAEAIRDKLGKSSVDDVVTQAELDGILDITAFGRGIVDISGVENLTNLTRLELFHNQISDVSPLSNLTSLDELSLSSNQISDVSPLSNLTNLSDLRLDSNQISDISPLSNLTDLNSLYLEENQLNDISPLSNLTDLNSLYLSSNQISDVSPLSNLTNLSDLRLNSNQISDISPLSNLTNLIYLILDNNQISDISPLSNLTSLGALYLSNQNISESKMKWNDPLSVTNSIKDNNGNLIAPSSISNQGSYADPTITWTGLTNTTQQVNYKWNQSVTIGSRTASFTGTVSLTVEKREQYNVNFDIDGQITTELVEAGELVIKPQDPSKDGYVFTGWYDAETDGNEWDFTTDTMPANDMTLYAQFSKVLIPMPTNAYINFYEDSILKYAIPYVGLDQWDGINGVWTNGFVTANPPANNPTKTGHTFTGWEDEQGDLFDFSTTQLDLNSQNEFNFYAAFEKKEYIVTFDIEGKKETQKVLFEDLIKEPVAPKKEGHKFVGWYTSPQTKATKWDFSTMGMPANDLTLHAKFTKLSDSGSESGGSEKPSKPTPPVTPEQPENKESPSDSKDKITTSNSGSMTVTSQENISTSSEASQQSKLAKLGEQNSMILQGFGLLMVISGIAFFWWRFRKAHL
ncbi:internalin [Listeria monocytogenes]|nr:internalin [Listeria monocytogenes]